jgi:hypothetical protein
MNQTESAKMPMMENNYLYEMVVTLKEMKEISKESLIYKKKLVKLL